MLWIALLAAGASVALGVWFVCRPWTVMSEAPPADCAAGLRWVWPWILALEPVCAPLLSWRMRRRSMALLRQGGLDAVWSAERWFALRVSSGGLASSLCIAVILMLELWPGGGALPVAALLGAVPGFCLPDVLVRRRSGQRRVEMLREFPFMLDLMTLCVEAGLSLHGALMEVARHAPEGPLRESLRQALSAMRAGMARGRALHQWADRCTLPAVRSLVLSLEQADQLGMNLGPLLRSQAAEQRSERFLRAEKLALEAPVKMLFPMVLCIFPCTFLIIGFPVAIKLLNAGF